MATSRMIERALWIPSKPASDLFANDALLVQHFAFTEVDEAERRKAALWVADYFAASHGCNRTKKRRCTKPEHARDVEQAREWLTMLALVEETPTAAEEVKEPTPAPRPRPRVNVQWQFRAACRGEDQSLFFPSEGERQPERDLREAVAKAVCSRCPVRRDCLVYAITHSEKAGVWGGLNEDERNSERRRRTRARAAGARSLEVAS